MFALADLVPQVHLFIGLIFLAALCVLAALVCLVTAWRKAPVTKEELHRVESRLEREIKAVDMARDQSVRRLHDKIEKYQHDLGKTLNDIAHTLGRLEERQIRRARKEGLEP